MNTSKFYQQPLFQLTISSIIFGLGAVFVVFIDLGAAAIAFYRLLIGGILFGLILFLRREPLAIAPETLWFASLAGVFFGLDLALWNQSILLIGPGVATILNSLQVFFMAAFGIAFYRDKSTWKLWVSLCVTFIGVVLLSSHEIHSSQTGGLGITVGILSGLAFAASMLSLREAAKRQKHSLINTMFYASISGALATGIYGFFANAKFLTTDVSSWVMIAVYATVVHVIAWFLMAKSMPYVSVALVGLIVALEPVTVFGIDLFFLGKSITLWQAIGAILTLGAIYLGSQSSKKS